MMLVPVLAICLRVASTDLTGRDGMGRFRHPMISGYSSPRQAHTGRGDRSRPRKIQSPAAMRPQLEAGKRHSLRMRCTVINGV